MKYCIYVLLIGLIFSCRTPYQPTLNSQVTNYLVVEGVINTSSTDSTYIKLSRTVGLTSATGTKPELRAQVWIEDGQGFTVMLKEIANGSYGSAPLALNNTGRYRLRIKTADNKTYLSDLVSVTNAPPIDSIGFYNKNTGIEIYVNTHDPNNNTRYYRWDFTETWKFLPAFTSEYMSNGTSIVRRTADKLYPSSCWASDISHNIAVSSSVKLSQDVIDKAPLTYIEGTSEKISVRYSILVRQYALTKEAYTFWEQLRKNTESLGSIFDAQPSESQSNIHCIDNLLEPVLGYMSVSNVQTKRQYFNKADMHISVPSDAFKNCAIDSQYFSNPKTSENQVANNLIPDLYIIPTVPFFSKDGFTIGYLSSGLQCVDCRTRGSGKQPPFWRDF